jgi:diketogulonate reductase-like aldo/keto reductase
VKVASPVKKFGVTSKLWPSEYGEGKTMEGIDKMLERLDIGYIDLLLLHQQVGDYMGAWKDMEKALKQGKVKTIGLKK